MIQKLAALALLSAGMTATAAYASAPETPSLKPDRIFTSEVTDPANAEIINKAIGAARRGQWSTVKNLQLQASDPSVRNLITWLRASEGVPGMGFDELSDALIYLQDWPSTSRIRSRAESLIGDSTLTPQQRIDWMIKTGPITGAGKVALADAYVATGQPDVADTLVRDAWRNNTLDESDERHVLSRYGNALSQDDHRARVDLLLWINHRTAARRIMSRISADDQKLAKARIALAAGSRGVDTLIKAVPARLQADGGLLYERARWRRKRKNQSGATELLVQIDGARVPEAGRARLWDERNIALRTALKDKAWDTSYALAANHGLISGGKYAAAEWNAGWVALRHLKQPEIALRHFRDLGSRVSTPISLSRASYWEGRALDALGRTEEARTAYETAAQHNFAYYGQLAAEQIGKRSIDFGADTMPTEADRAAFNARPQVKAMRLLGETGNSTYFRRFAYDLDDRLTAPADFTLLGELAASYQINDIGVRGAKAGLAKGIVSPDAAYPIVTYPLSREPNVERSLILALSRQESEMNPKAVSHAGARGLMQFMPATAKLEARKRGLPYRKSWLTDDPAYNMTLGGAHLDTLLGQFNGSYIMTAAAYNAGPSRPNKWIVDYGDPRTGIIDPIDWVEFIPFSETRNYVQRVLENTQVYRHRLDGQPVDSRLNEDLNRGQY